MIGFVNYEEPQEENKEIEIQNEETLFYNSKLADAILKKRAEEMAMKAVKEYLQLGCYPLIRGEKRDEWLTERLRKIRERYLIDV